MSPPLPDGRRAGRVARAVEAWFAGAARDLPWRRADAGPDGARRDPWSALVAEAMLQQTQVARVVEKFGPFLERYPTPAALASAREEEVLAAWAGLGYYRRARSLQAAARAIVAVHAGGVPSDPAALRRLPGVGAYTAGAVASIVFGRREPIVDGNVARVLLRVEGRDLDPADRETQRWAWAASERLVGSAGDPGVCNEGLMELGATVCTPASPRCGSCPLARSCRAKRLGLTGSIPRPRPRAGKRAVYHDLAVVRDGAGRVLVERRPAGGLWAGMVQPVGVESENGPSPRSAVARAAGVGAGELDRRGSFVFQTTHRAVHFTVYDAATGPAGSRAADREGRSWVAAADLPGLPLANPHRAILLQGRPGREPLFGGGGV